MVTASPPGDAAAAGGRRPALASFYEGPDDELRIALKQVAKKAVATKLKALEVLIVAFGDRPNATLRDALPHWARVYEQLCLHNDRRIRAQGNAAHATLVVRVRKAAAKSLPLLVAPWRMSMEDPAPEVARQAQQAWAECFSDSETRASVRIHGPRPACSRADAGFR